MIRQIPSVRHHQLARTKLVSRRGWRLALHLAIHLLLGLFCMTTPAAAQQPPFSLDGIWRASWIEHPEGSARGPGVYHFRRDIVLDAVPASLVVRVSADNRFRLFVNGVAVAVGPARSDVLNWRYERVDLAPFLVPGANRIAATVWNWGDDDRPTAQMSLRTGFLLEGEDGDLLDSDADWQVLRDPAFSFRMPTAAEHAALGGYYVAAPAETFDARAHPWGWDAATSAAEGWVAARPIASNMFTRAVMRGALPFGTAGEWQLVESGLPMMEEAPVRFASIRRASGVAAQPGLIAGSADQLIPARTRASLLLDNAVLTNAYPVLRASGGAGARMQLTFAEALVDAAGSKGDRNDIAGKTIRGIANTIIFDGGDNRVIQPLWWRSYRYVQLDIETGDQPLVLHDIHGIFTAYPMQQRAAFASDLAWIDPIWEIDWRGLRLSAFDTYMDTPYWEQLQYVGDTRIEALVTLYNAGDDRLMRNALTLFDQSRGAEGITTSRYPSAEIQNIPPFSLWWVAMVHDYWMHRDDPAFVAGFLPGIRGVISWYEGQVDDTGLLGPMPWWNFLDWAPEFGIGMAPGSQDGHSATLTLQFAYTLRRAADLEEQFGEAALAARYRALADRLGAAVRAQAWDETRGLFADTPEKASFSQHAQVLAILAGAVPAAEQPALMERVLADDSLIEATVYFRFYVDEALVQTGLGDRYPQRLDLWREMIRMGLTTTPESPEPTRSDSHAWASHPNYHLLASVLGIRPASPGFRTVRIAPELGVMTRASGTVPHPAGPISVDLQQSGDGAIAGRITLPPGLSGTFVWHGREMALAAGTQTVALSGN